MWVDVHPVSQARRLLHLVLFSDQVGHDLNAGSETAPMNNAPGHVYQPTSRADTLRVLYSALSVTMSTTFRSNNSPSPVCVNAFPLGAYKIPGRGPPSLPVLQTVSSLILYPISTRLQSSCHLTTTPRMMCSLGPLRILDRASCSANGASSSIDFRYA